MTNCLYNGREGTSASNEKPMKSLIFFSFDFAFYLSDYLFCISKRTSSRTIHSTFCVFQGIYSKWCSPTPPPFLFTYEKVRYHIAYLKKRFFFDNLYARMITLILVFLITETGLLQLVFRFLRPYRATGGNFHPSSSPVHLMSHALVLFRRKI